MANGHATLRGALESDMSAVEDDGDSRLLFARLGRAPHAEVQTRQLATDVATLTGWLGHDMLSLAGPCLDERRDLFDFIVEQLRLRESLAPHRIRPLRVALQRQHDDVVGFAMVFDDKPAAIARRRCMPLYWVRLVCRVPLNRPTSTAFSQRWNELHTQVGEAFVVLLVDVLAELDDTPQSGSEVENLNLRLRRYFLRCRNPGDAYLSLLQFFLNHRVFMRSLCTEQVGRKPRQLPTGQAHAQWLELLGFQRVGPA